MTNLFWTLIALLVALWLAGQFAHFGGPFIHGVLVIAVLLVVYNLLVNGRKPLP